MSELSGASVEGRLMAHRQLLSLILARLAQAPGGDDIWRILDERSVYQNAEEDPGEAPTRADGLQLALAEELRLVADEARAMRAASPADRPAPDAAA